MILAPVFFSIVYSVQADAFSKERCGRMFPQSDNDHPYFYSPIYITTMMPSTTSYFSSIGPCSMYGEYQGANRVSFIEDTLPSIRVDAARGEGEYLKTLAVLTGCPAEQHGKVASVMHSQFATVFASADDKDAAAQVARIDSALKSDAGLKKSCPGLN